MIYDHSARHDFFVSYKWRTYAAEAAEVARQLQQKGFSVFLDCESLSIEPGERIPQSRLKYALEKAVKNSECLIFFETFGQAEVAIEMVKAMTVDGGEIEVPRTGIAFNWQEFERAYASRLIYVYPRRNIVTFPESSEDVAYDSIERLVAIITQRHAKPR